ncbi:MAG: RHS repeat-associated core domain-containing protein [Thermodesulfobacteriota bacterium]
MEIRGGNGLVEFTLGLGPDGRVAVKRERVGVRTAEFAYEYDPRGRLVRVRRDGRTAEEYAYDPQGRRVADAGGHGGRRRLEYDGAGRLIRAGDATYAYGPDGTLRNRRDRRGGLHLAYGRNLGLEYACTPGGREIECRSNQYGQPLEKSAGGAPGESFRWLDLLRLGAYRAADKGYSLAFHYPQGERLPHAATYADEEGSRTLRFGYDQVGSLKAVADERGEVLKRIDYDSFGNVLAEDWPWLFVPLGFAGGVRDRDTGFLRFGYRDYDPEVGRFVAQDPLGDTGGDHDPYEYCVDDPVNAVDPAGLFKMGGWPLRVLRAGLQGVKDGAINGAVKGIVGGPYGMLVGAVGGAAMGAGSGMARSGFSEIMGSKQTAHYADQIPGGDMLLALGRAEGGQGAAMGGSHLGGMAGNGLMDMGSSFFAS